MCFITIISSPLQPLISTRTHLYIRGTTTAAGVVLYVDAIPDGGKHGSAVRAHLAGIFSNGLLCT